MIVKGDGANDTVALQFLEEGRREFLAGHYFEAHDIWEEFWERLRGPDRLYLQGLIHLAVGAYHHDNGNIKGARSQWDKAARKISRYPTGHWGINTAAWIEWIGDFLRDGITKPHPRDLPFNPEEFPGQLTMAAG